jgi:hypothetical protein
MKAITLRNLPPEVARLIQKKAKQNKSSINKTIVGLLEGSVAMKRKKTPPRYQDLDALAGSWTAEEARAFEKALALQRDIDPDLWK